jgi:DNA polymerase V
VLSNNDGCIISLTDEAKKLGIGMASPYYQNREMIEKNEVAVFSSNYNLYGDLSLRVMDTLKWIAGENKVEVYSVDEAFVDVSQVPAKNLEAIAHHIRETVEEWTGIKVSVGVGPSKVLAKLANRLSKKNKVLSRGVMVINSSEKIKEALAATPVDEVWGVGRQFAKKLQALGISNAWQLSCMPEEWARKNMGGVVGSRLIRELNGESCIPMKDPLEQKKMIATTRMFGRPVSELNDIKEAVATYASRAAEKLRRQSSAASNIDVFVVTNGKKGEPYFYNPQTRHQSFTLPEPTSQTNELIRHAVPLVEKMYQPGFNYQKAGIILSGLVPDTSIQGNLFNIGENKTKRGLLEAVDNINFSQRDDLVKFVATGLKRNWKMRQELRSKRYTSRWNELFEIR